MIRAALSEVGTEIGWTEWDRADSRTPETLRRYGSPTVLVNGRARTRPEYVADVMATTNTFPDYRWELRRAVWDGEWLAVRDTRRVIRNTRRQAWTSAACGVHCRATRRGVLRST